MTALLLHELEIHLARGLHQDAAAAGLRDATARVLLAVREGESVAMTDVARRVGRDPTTATRFVDRAVSEGLLTRTQGAHDKRRRVVSLTESGRATRARLAGIRTARAEALTYATLAETGLGVDQLEWFLQALLTALDDQT
jgi:DNA-binding MarR family transcriptional regulator